MSVEIGNIYKRYDGKEYFVVWVARHTETSEQLIIYHTLDSDKFDDNHYGIDTYWAMPEHLFESFVEVNGKQVKMFIEVNE